VFESKVVLVVKISNDIWRQKPGNHNRNLHHPENFKSYVIKMTVIREGERERERLSYTLNSHKILA
jgi:hypothetical protein